MQSHPNLLRQGELHLWLLDTTRSSRLSPLGWSSLPQDERERAESITHDRARESFVLGKLLLRTLLGRELGAPPDTLAFRVGAHGKPELADPAQSGLRFNLSHSGRFVLLAMSRDWELGVDIEDRSERGAQLKILDRFFTASEKAWILAASDESEQTLRFFKTWCRKEAFIKATGNGIAQGLQSFDTSAGPRVLIQKKGAPGFDPSDYFLLDLPIPEPATAAVCVHAPPGHTAVPRQLQVFAADSLLREAGLLDSGNQE